GRLFEAKVRGPRLDKLKRPTTAIGVVARGSRGVWHSVASRPDRHEPEPDRHKPEPERPAPGPDRLSDPAGLRRPLYSGGAAARGGPDLMPPSSLSAVVRQVRKLAAPSDLPAAPDSDLLARFRASGDEAAFAALVRRHGPLVMGVCRRVLRHHQDAEDAFQAPFLVLARKAASLDRRPALAAR